MVNLSRHNASYKIYAPDIPQMHVINHTNGEEMKETRSFSYLFINLFLIYQNVLAFNKLFITDKNKACDNHVNSARIM